ncbi:hypothetical protein HGM15179_020979, partial [Zosterops borbonicus]
RRRQAADGRGAAQGDDRHLAQPVPQKPGPAGHPAQVHRPDGGEDLRGHDDHGVLSAEQGQEAAGHARGAAGGDAGDGQGRTLGQRPPAHGGARPGLVHAPPARRPPDHRGLEPHEALGVAAGAAPGPGGPSGGFFPGAGPPRGGARAAPPPPPPPAGPPRAATPGARPGPVQRHRRH